MNQDKSTVEERILAAVRETLVEIVRDTTTAPGLIHPLSEQARDKVRHCFDLITARQIEIDQAAGISHNERPVYPDQK